MRDTKTLTGAPAGTKAIGTGVAGAGVVALILRVHNPDCACDEARRFADKTFMVADSPTLPFKSCTRADCRCHYERIAERRKIGGERRVTANRREQIRFEMKDDRRTGKDRRQKNNVWKQPV